MLTRSRAAETLWANLAHDHISSPANEGGNKLLPIRVFPTQYLLTIFSPMRFHVYFTET